MSTAARFIGEKNVVELYKRLVQSIPEDKLKQVLMSNIYAFARVIEGETQYSDQIIGTESNQLDCYNRQFISWMLQRSTPETTPYTVNDGEDVGRRFVGTADAMLSQWKSNPARPRAHREDEQGSHGATSGKYLGIQGESPGIVFHDQSGVGLSNSEMYETATMRAMNAGRTHERVSFVSNPDTDQRLLSTRVFKNNERGVENGIAARQARLHRRNLDTDVTEGLRSSERDFITYGQDLSGLHARVDEKRRRRDEFASKK